METTTEQEQQDVARRDAMANFIRRTGWSFVLKDIATKRWERDVTVRIAEKGTFKDVPVKGWTNTDTGTIFMREEIFDGIDFTNSTYRRTVEIVIAALVQGEPINKARFGYVLSYASEGEKETIWRIAQTLTANFGVFGHEYCHAAYSEHAARNAWHMGLEDLRAESLWMTQDPIRARQGLRACASFWVTHDASPMAGEKAFDMSGVKSHADLLHLYLLLGGRGRIGVLDDQSVLVTGVRSLAEEILGWETVSDANDIIDQFIETSEDPDDAEGADRRRALAKEFAALLPKDAGEPSPGGGCACNPEDGEGEGEGEGQGPGQDQDAESDESKSGGGEDGEKGTGDATAPQPGSDAEAGDEEGSDAGKGGKDSDDDGLTVGSNKTEEATPDGAQDGDEGENEKPEDSPDFITGTFGEQIKPGNEDVTDALDTSDAYQLTQDQVNSLNEILSEGLEEVSDEGEAGWAISDETGEILKSRSVAPALVAKDVFSKQALSTRNRRVRASL